MVGKELAFSGVLQRDRAQPNVQLGLGPELPVSDVWRAL